ncbi:MAG: excinuclease ABC subunit UvrA, partial [Deltaproteobacteria bacterium]|nr:excinuclease ABC subunit UvrA [Deltaproteobacteria bacterium]
MAKSKTNKVIPLIPKVTPKEKLKTNDLVIKGLRQNNLKNISLTIPHNTITGIVGPSGSGKSTLAFDTLFAEGRWRFMESMSTYTRMFLERMDRPELDTIHNIRPTIALEQKNPVRTSRSTVGTSTEIHDYLRLLYARAGAPHCAECDKKLLPTDPVSTLKKLLKEYCGLKAIIGFEMDTGDIEQAEAAIKSCLEKGFIRAWQEGETLLMEEAEEELKGNAVKEGSLKVVTDRIVIKAEDRARLGESLELAFNEGKGKAWVLMDGKTKLLLSKTLLCESCGTEGEKPSPVLFSFNHPLGACAECKGFGNILKYDEQRIFPDQELTLEEGAIEPWTKPAYTGWYDEFARSAELYDIELDKKYKYMNEEEKRLIFEGTEDFGGLDDFFAHLEVKKYKLHVRVFLSRYKGQFKCPSCDGARLNKKAISIKVGGKNISELSSLTIEEARKFFLKLELGETESQVAKEPLRQLTTKLEFLKQTGLGYITLDRPTKTLSGGESQRIHLTNQLAGALSGVLYILDEPSIGLHPRDNHRLIGILKGLRDLQNTVVVVEHDPEIISQSDFMLDLGPGAGEQGGQVMYFGPTSRVNGSLTGQYLKGKKAIPVPGERRIPGKGKWLTVLKAAENNLRDVDIAIPLGLLVCLTGVSGSGKSTFAEEILYKALKRAKGDPRGRPGKHRGLKGTRGIDDVVMVDQRPIGRTPRANLLTYTKALDPIRKLMADTREARERRLQPGHFSFNVTGGRCETCKGAGFEKVEMQFLSDVFITCPECGGRRFIKKVLEVTFQGKNIYDLLSMTVDQALVFFKDHSRVLRALEPLMEVGLGYMRLGQPTTTLSGGEAQRLKLSRHLKLDLQGAQLFIFDEPTTGLHFDDIQRFLQALQRLVAKGHTILVIEHNMDVI